MADITLESYTHSSSGAKATPEKLLNIVLTNLDTGVCCFIFKKQNGAYRKCIGTRNPALILNAKDAAITEVKPTDTKINFYDLTAMEFKAFSRNSVVAVLVF